MQKRALFSLLIAAMTCGAVACRTQQASAPLPTIATPVVSTQGGDQYFSLTTADGRVRTYMVHLPRGYDPKNTYPVMVVLHGGGGNSQNIADMSQMSPVADANGFIVVYPEGATREHGLGLPTWNAGTCCAYAAQANIDDVGFIRHVVAQVSATYQADRARIFVAGMSNGAMMAQRLACEAADLFAGAASVAGALQIPTCTPARPIPILLIHGTADESVPYNGGTGHTTVTRDYAFPAVEQLLRDWAARNGCSGQPATTVVPPLVDDGITIDDIAYQTCAAPVALYRINGGAHAWPGGRPGARQEAARPTQAFNASEAIWNFFK